jgi:hypothetical protein
MTRYLDAIVTLSNKACPRYYIGTGEDKVGCPCPKGRCWYDEQVARRKAGKRAIDPIDWPGDLLHTTFKVDGARTGRTQNKVPNLSNPPRAEPGLHQELVERAMRWLETTRKCMLVVGEVGAWSTNEFPDAIGWKPDGYSILVECKVTRSDFHNDKRKSSRRTGKETMGRERWYLAPKGILKAEDMPEGYGLIETAKSRIRILAKAATAPRPGCADAEVPLLANQARRHAWELQKDHAELKRLRIRAVAHEVAPREESNGRK